MYIDQISDEKNKDSTWIDGIAFSEGMRKLNEREKMILPKRFFKEKRKWR